MTDLLTTLVRGSRRLRVFFNGPLGSGAFTSTSYYAVVDADNLTSPPLGIDAVFAVGSDPSAVELALSADFLSGALYTVTVTAAPLSPSGTVSGSAQFRVGSPVQVQQDSEPETSDIDVALYGRDLQWAEGFVEDASGDLATVAGPTCWQSDMSRRMFSSGITWDPTYGPRAEQSVDAPGALSTPLGASLVAQARLDDRTAKASIDVAENASDPSSWHFAMTLLGRDKLQTIVLPIPRAA